MELTNLLLVFFLLLPFVFSLGVFLFLRSKSNDSVAGICLSLLRFGFILWAAHFLYNNNSVLHLQLPFLSAVNINFSLTISVATLAMAAVTELVFLFSYIMFPPSHRFRTVMVSLVMAFQGLIGIYLLSSSLLILYTIQILATLCLYFLIKFAMNSTGNDWNDESDGVAENIMVIYTVSSLFCLIWSIASDFREMPMQQSAVKAVLDIRMWLVGFFFALPIAPWSSWFNRAIEHLPEAVSILVVLLVSCVLYRQIALSSFVFLPQIEKYEMLFLLMGVLSCFFSACALFTKKSKREMLGYIPKFYVGLTLIAMGMYSQESFRAAFFLCIVLPIFTGVILYVSALQISNFRQNFLVGFFLAFLLGFPGTPLFQIFGITISRAIALGVDFTIVFGLVWFLYFVANVHICRRIFLDEKPAPNASTDIAVNSGKVMAFMSLMLLFVGALTLIS